jgi:hypothetical protein
MNSQKTLKEQCAQLLGWIKERRKPQSLGKDGFAVFAEDPFAAKQEQLNSYLKQVSRQQSFWEIKPEKWPAGRALLEASAEEKVQTLRALMVRLLFWAEGEEERRAERDRNILNFGELMQLVKANLRGTKPRIEKLEREEPEDPVAFRTLTVQLMHGELPFTADDLATLVDLVAEQNLVEIWYPLPSAAILSAAEAYALKSELSPALREQLNRWRWAIHKRNRPHKNERQGLERLKRLLGDNPLNDFPIQEGEAWSNAALQALRSLPNNRQQLWNALLHHCQTAESSKPAQKWLKRAMELVDGVGRDEFKNQVVHWFALVALPRPVHREPKYARWEADPDLLITDKNATILKGLAWSCSGFNDAEISRALSELAEVCFKKVRWLGPRCPRVGNACLHILSSTATEAAAAQLSKLDQVVKQPTAKKRIGKSLDQAAEATGQTRADLEEKSVPTFGLGTDGKLSRKVGQHAVELQVVDSRDVQLSWLAQDGKSLKTVPAEVKREHATELKQLQKLAKDVQKMLGAQRIRLERLLISEREWDFEAWRQRYLEQPLLSPIVRRLIWHFKHGEQSALGSWLDGKLVDVNSRPLDWLAPEARVRLWHPIAFPVETVAAWRRWLENNQICQPFKQAHREVYVLTDAELETANYSNRFAAHIIGQHQFAALATQRGWKYSFMGGFDFQSTPTLDLPASNLAAEFWVEPTGELADTGVSRYLATDQVRFLRDGQALPLSEVPAPVFTEVMRDVDLFVGVCSIGNDPAWQDRGEIEGAGTYWRDYSFGNLSASAKTRRDVLERLLPKLKIASRCVLQDRFLVVTGSLRTYKIHLGSGNILMDPNDQYLCIVPDRGSGATGPREVFLPFEGDNTLSVILSKAFLLAEDAKIKDKTILSQIRST